MSDDPKPKIDDLLSAYAASRKQTLGNPPALHPAQKRILMGEVSKKFRHRPTRFSFALLWPKLAFSAATLFMLAGFVLFIREAGKPSAFEVAALHPDSASTELGLALLDEQTARGRSLERFRRVPEQLHREQEIAFDTPAIQTDTLSASGGKVDVAKRSAISADRAPINKSLADKDSRLEPQIEETRSKAKLRSTSSPQASSKIAALDNVELKMNQEVKKAEASAVNEPAPLPTGRPADPVANRGYVTKAPEKPVSTPTALPSLATSRALEVKRKVGDTLNEKEALSYGAKLPSNTASDPAVLPLLPLLSEFQLKRSGSAIEIVDYDGSVYSGNVTTNRDLSNKLTVSSGLKDKFYFKAATENRHGEQSELYQFAVSGTNVTLGKPVLLTGHYYFYTPTNKNATSTNKTVETAITIEGLLKIGTNTSNLKAQKLP